MAGKNASPGGSGAKGAEELNLGKPETILSGLDPHLQETILTYRSKEPHDRTVAREDESGRVLVDVIVKVKDPAVPVPGLNVVRQIGDILTGTVAVEDIESVRTHANIQSLKRATELHPHLNFSVKEIEANQERMAALSAPATPAVNGKGAIVGVVDYDLDFVHRNFRHPDGTTRILFLWDQTSAANDMSPAGFNYGREFTADMLDQALETDDPYGALAYEPEEEAHGTHVTDIAAGNGQATGRPGVAPGAGIIFVQLHGGDVRQEDSFGNSRTLLEAVDYIFQKAAELGRPAAVNMSLGTHGGPHDGSTLAEQAFDKMLEVPGRAIVISAGNSRERRSHASGTLAAGQTRTLGWEILAGDRTTNELEVWSQGNRQIECTLITPGGTRLGPVLPNQTVPIQQAGQRVGSIVSRTNDPNNGDNQINIILSPVLPKGTWQLELRSRSNEALTFDAWIERDDRGQSRFVTADDDRRRTVGSISCGRKTIVVGSYKHRVLSRALSSFSSEGTTRDGKRKPEVSAPGDEVLAAASRSQGAIRMSGTSMSAPHVTGLAALTMQAAGRQLTCDEIREAVITHARRNPPPGADWHSRYGFGRVSAEAAARSVLPAPVHASVVRTRAVAAGAGAGGTATAEAGMAPGDAFLGQIVEAAHKSQTRVRIEIEVEPAGLAHRES
ncbi:MAG: S8 family peptidase [Acidobacteria bacterium]|nr:S8 family peptidase [Acidobacteriota bacterium]